MVNSEWSKDEGYIFQGRGTVEVSRGREGV